MLINQGIIAELVENLSALNLKENVVITNQPFVILNLFALSEIEGIQDLSSDSETLRLRHV